MLTLESNAGGQAGCCEALSHGLKANTGKKREGEGKKKGCFHLCSSPHRHPTSYKAAKLEGLFSGKYLSVHICFQVMPHRFWVTWLLSDKS